MPRATNDGSNASSSGTGATSVSSPLDGGALEAWSKCASVMADASLALAVQATSTLSMWASPLASSQSPSADHRESPVPAAAPTRAIRRPIETTDEPKSWYRSPYRSPFDPMFWLAPETCPGAAASAFPVVSFPAPALAFPAMPKAMWPNAGAFPFPFAWPPQFAGGSEPHAASAQFAAQIPAQSIMLAMAQAPTQMLGQMFSGQLPAGVSAIAPFMSGAMTGAATNAAMTRAMSGAPSNGMMAAWQPLMSSWMAMMCPPTRPSITPALEQAASAYRSMGGFAVAQAFMDTASAKPAPATVNMQPWFDLAFPWLRR